jgi:endoplasmic reticulum Man9GlcNAc2 1,2-alpha-mannosidase
MYRRMYDQAMHGVKTRLIDFSLPSNLLFVGELLHSSSNSIIPKMDHLVCFLGGNLALGATEGRTLKSKEDYDSLPKNAKEDLRIGRALTDTCAKMYFTTVTGLAPEIVYFNMDKLATDDLYIKTTDSHSLLRPETVESLFVLWRITRDEKYR